MLEPVPDVILRMEVAIPLVVGLLIAARMLFGGAIFHVRWTAAWNVIRSLKVPVINSYVLGTLVPFDFEIENEAHRDEFVGVSPHTPKEIEMLIAESVDSEVPLLAGFKTDWAGREEAGTAVSYHGSRPWPGAPNWLRPRQTHRTHFRVRGPDGWYTLITAHEEANSWRADQWIDHLKKHSFSAREGVRRTVLKLEESEVDWQPSAEWLEDVPDLTPGEVEDV